MKSVSHSCSWAKVSKKQVSDIEIDDIFGLSNTPDSKVHGVIMGPIWGRQDPGGPHVGPMNFAIWGIMSIIDDIVTQLFFFFCISSSTNVSFVHEK